MRRPVSLTRQSPPCVSVGAAAPVGEGKVSAPNWNCCTAPPSVKYSPRSRLATPPLDAVTMPPGVELAAPTCRRIRNWGTVLLATAS